MSDYLNTSDLSERLEELRAAADDGPLDHEDREELAELVELESTITDWKYGETLIPEDRFEDYARELAEDIGAVDKSAGWPSSFIDWPAAADALRMDFTSVEYQGSTYLVR